MSRALARLSDDDLRALAGGLRSGRLAPPFKPLALQRFLPPDLARDAAADLSVLAAAAGAVACAAALDLVLADRERRAAEHDVEIVSTGPGTAAVPNRETAVVVRELFRTAERHLLVTGYAVYQGREVFRALAERMAERPGLAVVFCLDVPRPDGDRSAADQVAARFAYDLRTSQWPAGVPLPAVYFDPRSLDADAKKRSCLHAKCVVADRARAFVSSANLTEAAQQRNIELGVLLRSPPLAGRIVRHFEGLIDAGVLRRLPSA